MFLLLFFEHGLIRLRVYFFTAGFANACSAAVLLQEPPSLTTHRRRLIQLEEGGEQNRAGRSCFVLVQLRLFQ
jgi:hypothetical protein